MTGTERDDEGSNVLQNYFHDQNEQEGLSGSLRTTATTLREDTVSASRGRPLVGGETVE
jgi:hypothetical protein